MFCFYSILKYRQIDLKRMSVCLSVSILYKYLCFIENTNIKQKKKQKKKNYNVMHVSENKASKKESDGEIKKSIIKKKISGI